MLAPESAYRAGNESRFLEIFYFSNFTSAKSPEKRLHIPFYGAHDNP